MGVGGEGYLASPAVVAASALMGYMAPPSELGLEWDPERSTGFDEYRPWLYEADPVCARHRDVGDRRGRAAVWPRSSSPRRSGHRVSPRPRPAQQPTFRTGVDVITVDVAALDSRGQPVTDLHGPEFTVKIDGQVRRVVSADLVKYEYTPDTGGLRRPRAEAGDVRDPLHHEHHARRRAG